MNTPRPALLPAELAPVDLYEELEDAPAYRTLREAASARVHREESETKAELTAAVAKSFATEHGLTGSALEKAVADLQNDVRWQAFLGGAPAGTHTSHAAELGNSILARLALGRLDVVAGDVATAQVTRATVGMNVAVPGSDSTVGVSQDFATRGASYQNKIQMDGGSASVGGSIYGSRNVKGMGASATGSVGGAFVGLGMGATLVHRASVEATEQRRVIDGVPHILAAHKTEVMPVLSAQISGGELYVGGGVRFVALKGRAAEHQKFVPMQELGAELRKRDVWYSGLREMGEALGVVRGLKAVSRRALAADSKMTETFRVGEQLTWLRTGGVIFGMSVGGMGARTGVYAQIKGESTMVLSRPEEHIMELEVAHHKGATVSFNAEVPVLAEAYQSTTQGLLAKRIFRFDLTKPGAVDALKGALEGKMPTAASVAVPKGDSPQAQAESFLQAISGEHLPEGVSTVRLESAKVRQSTVGAAAIRPMFFADRLDAVAHSRSKASGTRVVAEDGMALLEHSAMSSKATELLRKNTQHAVVARLQHVPQKDVEGGLALVGVRVDQVFDQARSTLGSRMQVVSRVKPGASAQVPMPKLSTRGAAYKAEITRLFEPEHLGVLAKSSASAVAEAARDEDVNAGALKAFVLGLEGATAEKQAEALRGFVVSTRSKGINALVRLLGASAPAAQARIDNSAYDAPLANYLDFGLRIGAVESLGDMRAELKNLDKILRDLEQGVHALNDDKLYRLLDEKTYTAAHLELWEAIESGRVVREAIVERLATATKTA